MIQIIKHLRRFASRRLNNGTGCFLRSCILLLLIQFSLLPSLAQEEKPSRQAAEEAWVSGDYETAYRNYNGLLLLYSRDPVYGYYTGACLVKLQRDIQRAVTLLGSASHSSQSVKTIPDEIWFYYGRALQMSGNYTEATGAFDKYVKVAGKKRAQELNVQAYLEECAVRKGSIASSGASTLNTPGEAEKPQVPAQEKKPLSNNTVPADVRQKSNSADAVSKTYDRKLTQAVRYQFISDSLLRIAEGIRRQIETAPRESVGLMKSRITELENQAGKYLSVADSIFLELEPDPVVKTPDTLSNESEASLVAGNNLKQEPGKATAINQGNQPKAPENEKKAVFSFFEVKGSPFYSVSNPVPVGQKMPEGLIYHVQLAAFKNPVSPLYFRNLYPVFGILNATNGVTYYYTGMFRTYEAASQALPMVRKNGFTDAFIVAFADNIQVSMEKATQLERIWAGKPLFYEDYSVKAKINNDPVPAGTLTFRAEVLRSLKPVKPEVTEKIVLLAGNKGVDITKNNKGETIILIGNFITFESADEYVSLLIRNGYSSARVVAYVGSNEIPVESAKELFKKLLNE